MLIGHLTFKNGLVPSPGHSSPVASKRNGPSQSNAHSAILVGSGPNSRRLSPSSPLASSRKSATGSSGSYYSPADHYQTVNEQQCSESGEVSDSGESHEYAYAYPNPIENARSAASTSTASQDLGQMTFPRLNGYLRPFNSTHNYHSTHQQVHAKANYDPQYPRSLTSHILPNGSCFVDRTALNNTQPTESPRIVIKNSSPVRNFNDSAHRGHLFQDRQERLRSVDRRHFGTDGDDEEDDGQAENCQADKTSENELHDNESSLYAEAQTYSPHPVVYSQSYQVRE